MKYKLLFIPLIVLVALAFIQDVEEYKLTSQFDEISGITFNERGQLVALNDEKGNVYVLDMKADEMISSKIDFGKDADYEGLCFVDDAFYALVSNGDLIRFESENKIKKYKGTQFTWSREFEGVCYQASKNRLLLACKGAGGLDANHIWIYSFDLQKKEFSVNPVYEIERGDALIHFRPSGITFDLNGDLLLISGPTAQLLRYDLKEEIVLKLIDLDKDKYEQIEGIAIDSEGKIYIASEKGKKESAKLFVFKN